jgi:geranylgeranyl diphosphate synthase, type II
MTLTPGQRGRRPDDREDGWAGGDGLKGAIEQRLAELIDLSGTYCDRLRAAITYSLLAPGKRVRPKLAMLTVAHLHQDPRIALDFGCALEMIHCASLVLDDLPSMDDARMRRGRPTLHRVHGEDLAVLAAVALLNQAYAVILRDPGVAPAQKLTLVTELSEAVGANGLVSGQSRDLHERHNGIAREQLELINHQKTGVLFLLAVAGGCRLADAPGATRLSMSRFAARLGLAFQAADDLLDVQARVAETGKDAGQDRAKRGLVDVLGVDSARALVRQHVADALDALDECGLPSRTLHEYVHSLFRVHV